MGCVGSVVVELTGCTGGVAVRLTGCAGGVAVRLTGCAGGVAVRLTCFAAGVAVGLLSCPGESAPPLTGMEGEVCGLPWPATLPDLSCTGAVSSSLCTLPPLRLPDQSVSAMFASTMFTCTPTFSPAVPTWCTEDACSAAFLLLLVSCFAMMCTRLCTSPPRCSHGCSPSPSPVPKEVGGAVGKAVVLPSSRDSSSPATNPSDDPADLPHVPVFSLAPSSSTCSAPLLGHLPVPLSAFLTTYPLKAAWMLVAADLSFLSLRMAST